ncbi:long-chain fatty acid--CoA ligase [Veronia nyctiphanis]|uniref:Long-chain fatty acid--CoA ligase n=1 Tax=Veronia nyctiphanis TaxID=1278244 RepID=A0A4Q0YQE7_9GAMM|nr:AMP-binding protein [Veronia nyctiphanis]RXJ73246.1 long-chain fatty acid--CoA ligase [Veronia nyctiphanis]
MNIELNDMTDVAINKEFKSLADLFEFSMGKFSKSIAYYHKNEQITFAEVDEKSRAVAGWIQEYTDLVPGDRVLVQLPNIPEFAIINYGCLRAGLVLVNICTSIKDIGYLLQDSEAKIAFFSKDINPDLASTHLDSSLEFRVSIEAHDLSENSLSLNDIYEKGCLITLLPRDSDLDDLCLLQYTDGTSGRPKGACLSHRNIITNLLQLMQRVENVHDRNSEIVVCPLPFHHIFAFVANFALTFSCGNANILIPDLWDTKHIVEVMRKHKVTCFIGMNSLFHSLLEDDEFIELDFTSLSSSFCGGYPLSVSVAENWRLLTGIRITEGYGLTEASMGVCLNEPGNEQLETVGPPLIGTSVEVWNENDEPLGFGEVGQIVVKGPQVIKRYWKDEALNEKMFSSDGFHRTGDLGLLRYNGHIKLLNRKDDSIWVGDSIVYPREVEEVLVSADGVREAVVIGENDPLKGSRLHAFVIVTKDFVSKSELIEYCRDMLPDFYVPEKVTVTERLPRSSLGRVLRGKLRGQ